MESLKMNSMIEKIQAELKQIEDRENIEIWVSGND